MNKLKHFFKFVRLIIWMRKDLWTVSVAPIIHWHLVPLWSMDDYQIAWTELHKAHLIYARKLNKKLGVKFYDAGRKSRTKKNENN